MGHPRIPVYATSLALTTMTLVGVALTGCSTESISTTAGTGWVISEVRANTFTYNRQLRPTVATTADGGTVVAWASRRQEDGAFGVYAQRLDEVGRPVGPEVHLNQRTRGAQDQPAITVTTDDNVWITWSSTHTDGDARAIVARRCRLADTGVVPIGNEFIVNTTTPGDQAMPSIAAGADGGVLLLWTQTTPETAGIIARVFDSAGEPLTDEIQLSKPAGDFDSAAAVAATTDGYAVAWSRHAVDTGAWTVLAQRTDALGAPSGAPIIVDAAPGAMQIEPAIAADSAGVTTIAWLERNADSPNRIRVRRFDDALEPIADAFEIDHSMDSQRSGVAVTAVSDGRFAVLWNEEGDKVASPSAGKRPTRLADIMAQRFDSSATPIGESFILNSTRDSRQALSIGSVAPRAAWTERDQLIAVWHGATIGDHRGVGVSIANPPAIAAHAQSTPAPERTSGASVMAPPEFDPNFVPQPRDATARAVGADFGFQGIAATGWNPPDPELAVGPNHVVVVANGAIAWFLKDGTLQFQQPIEGGGGFWGAQGAQGFVFDPIALYDVHSNRFVVAAVERDNADVSFIVLAISNSSDPNAGWMKYRQNVESIAQGIDFPNLGVDETAVHISVDFFGPATGSYVFSYNKADLIAGILSGQVTQTAAFPTVTAGVYIYDPGSLNYYTLTSFNSSATQLRIQAIVDPLGGHNLFTHMLTVPNHSNPPDAPQAGTSNLASTIDIRIKHGVYRNGSLWCAHTVNAGGVARVRWYEISMNGWPQSGQVPTLTQTGDINPGQGIYTWFPDISVDNAGNAAIGYNRSSSSEFIKIARTVRKAGDPLGEFRQSIINQQSTSPELSSRWGDYSGVHEDPASPGVFWSSLEYRTSFWNTWVAKFSAINANPSQFSLLSPSNNATLATTTPQFNWSPAIDAATYTITIATDAQMNNVVLQQTGITGTSFSPPLGALTCSVQYHWGVTAVNPGGESVSTPVAWTLTAALQGDLNGDGVVDSADLGGLIGSFGSPGPFGDINGDGAVDSADLGLLISAFGNICN